MTHTKEIAEALDRLRTAAEEFVAAKSGRESRRRTNSGKRETAYTQSSDPQQASERVDGGGAGLNRAARRLATRAPTPWRTLPYRDAPYGGGGVFVTLDYLLPLARLWVTQSIWQFLRSVCPPFDQAVTWSASISSSL